MSNLELKVSEPDKKTILIELSGEFAGMDALGEESKLLGYLQITQKRLALNFSQVPYMDSAALGLVMKLAQEAGTTGKEFILVAPSENVMKVLKLTKVDSALKIVKTV